MGSDVTGGTASSIDALRLAELEAELELLRSSEERARITLEQAPLGMATVDLTGRFATVNRAFCLLTGWSAAQLRAMSFQEITHPDDLSRALEFSSALLSGRRERYGVDERYRKPDGSYIWVHVAVSLGRDEGGDPLCYLLHVQDIGARRQSEEELARLVLTDPLTGLANGRLLMDRLEHAIRRRARRGGEVAVIYVDLDELKAINRELGHGIGDRVLQELARRLAETVRDDDTVSRYGSDEFVLCCELADAAHYTALLERVQRVCSAPLVLGGEIIPVSASVGGVLVGRDEAAEQALERADGAMHRDRVERENLSEVAST